MNAFQNTGTGATPVREGGPTASRGGRQSGLRKEIAKLLERAWELGVISKYNVRRKTVRVAWTHDLGRWGYESRWHRLPLTTATLEQLKEMIRQAEVLREL